MSQAKSRALGAQQKAASTSTPNPKSTAALTPRSRIPNTRSKKAEGHLDFHPAWSDVSRFHMGSMGAEAEADQECPRHLLLVTLFEEYSLIMQKRVNQDVHGGLKDLRPQGSNIFQWTATIQGGAGSPYEGVEYDLDITFPVDYPEQPFEISFRHPAQVFHPNCDPLTGAIACPAYSTDFHGCERFGASKGSGREWSPHMYACC